MKTFICILAMVFALSRATADSKNILLDMEKGHEYIYDWVVKTYAKKETGDSSNLAVHRKVLRMEVLDAIPQREITLKVSLLKNFRELPNKVIKNKTDYFFPDYYDDMRATYGRDLSEELFCRVNFIYRLNLLESTLELVNWTELLLGMSDLLREYSYDEDVREMQIEDLKNRKLHNFSAHVWCLIEYNNITIANDNKISRPAGKESLPYSFDQEGNLVITAGKDEFSANNKFSRTWLNADNGQVIKLVRKVYHERKGLGFIGQSWNVTETNFSLRNSGIPKPKTLHISGTVSHPVSKKINVTCLDRPFGFILNEVKCYFYLPLFSYISSVYAYENYMMKKYSQTDELMNVIQFVEGMDIHDIYNDYGVYSRWLTGSYLRYYFDKIRKVEASIPVLSQFTGSWKNLEQTIQFGRIILVGSPLYREIAGQLDNDLNRHHDPRLDIKYLQVIYEDHFMFMSR